MNEICSGHKSFIEKLTRMEKKFSDFEEKITSMDNQLTEMDKKLTQVVDAILGNPLTKSGGFILEIHNLNNKIKLLEDRIKIQDIELDKQREFRSRFIWIGAIIVGAGVFIQWLVSIYANLKR